MPMSKTRVVTKTGPQSSSLTRQPSNHTNPVLLPKTTRNISLPQRTLPMGNIRASRPETATSVGTATTGGTAVKSKSTTSKVIKPVPPSTSKDLNVGVAATARTTVTKNALAGPAKSTYHKSAVSLSSRPAGVATRVATSTVRRPHTVLDMNKKRDKPVGAQGAQLMLVKDLHANGDVVGEDFLFDV